MSYSVDVNLLLYASDMQSPEHEAAKSFLLERAEDPDLFCVSWLTLMGYQRMATHAGIFASPSLLRKHGRTSKNYSLCRAFTLSAKSHRLTWTTFPQQRLFQSVGIWFPTLTLRLSFGNTG